MTSETAIHPEEARMLAAQSEVRGVVLARRTAVLRAVLDEYERTGGLSEATLSTVRAALAVVMVRPKRRAALGEVGR